MKTTEHPPTTAGVSINDFVAYMPAHKYIFLPLGELWPAPSVDARVGPQIDRATGKQISASKYLDQYRPVDQMIWAPGAAQLIEGRLMENGGWINRDGVKSINLYRPPNLAHGDLRLAGPWIEHVERVFGDDAMHIIKWLAQRVQRPHEKINHALLLGGPQGIGKDTILEGPKRAVGPWNFNEVSPDHLHGRFNGFVKSTILRVNEARDLGEVNRFSFYERMKIYTAAPPDVLRVDQKHLNEYSVINCVGVIITTNHKTGGIYLPSDDRRHFVAWSNLSKDDFDSGYWNNLWGWYENGGYGHVAAYLAKLDLSDFDPKAPPPKTSAFWDIVSASSAPEDAELADAIDALGNPDVLTITDIAMHTTDASFHEWITDRRNRRIIPHRLEQAGYIAVRNENAATDHSWKFGNKRQMVYAKRTLSPEEQLRAVGTRIGRSMLRAVA